MGESPNPSPKRQSPEKILRTIYSKVRRQLITKEPTSIQDAEKDRQTISGVALGSNNFVILELDKETYSGFIDTQKLRDHQKISNSVSPRQRAALISAILMQRCRPLFVTLNPSPPSSIIQLLQGLEPEPVSLTSKQSPQALFHTVTDDKMGDVEPLDTTKIKKFFKKNLGKKIKLSDLSSQLTKNEFMALPLVFSELDLLFLKPVDDENDEILIISSSELGRIDQYRYESVMVRAQ